MSNCWRCNADHFYWTFEEQAQGLHGEAYYDRVINKTLMTLPCPIGVITLERYLDRYSDAKNILSPSYFNVWIRLPSRDGGYWAGTLDVEEFMTVTDYDAYKQKINKLVISCIFTEAQNEATMIIENSKQIYSDKDKDDLTRKIFESMITR